MRMGIFPRLVSWIIQTLSIVWAEEIGLFAEKCKKNKKLLLTFALHLLYYAHRNSGNKQKGKAPVAQLDRASDYGSEGLGFESLRACFLNTEAFGLRKSRSCSTEPAFFDSYTSGVRKLTIISMGASRFRLNIRGAGCMWRLIGWPP